MGDFGKNYDPHSKLQYTTISEDITMFQWLKDHNLYPNVQTCNIAAEEGHFGVLHWLKSIDRLS